MIAYIIFFWVLVQLDAPAIMFVLCGIGTMIHFTANVLRLAGKSD